MMKKSETKSPRHHACRVGFSHVIFKVVTSFQYFKGKTTLIVNSLLTYLDTHILILILVGLTPLGDSKLMQ